MKKTTFSIILFVVLLELGLSAYDFIILQSKTKLQSITIPANDTLMQKLKPNYKNNFYSINSLGFRNKEFSINKKKGTKRIIGIGNSCMFGVHIREGKTFCNHLENFLNMKNGDHSYEVINAGVPGYRSNQCLEYFKKSLIKLNPDAIILYTGWNNMWIANYLASLHIKNKNTKIRKILSISKIFFWFDYYYCKYAQMKLAREIGKNDFDNYSEFIYNLYEKDIRKIITICKENKITPIILTRPSLLKSNATFEDKIRILGTGAYKNNNEVYSYGMSYDELFEFHTKLNQILRDISKEKAILIDLENAFYKIDSDLLFTYFFEFVHLNEKGAEIIASMVSNELDNLNK